MLPESMYKDFLSCCDNGFILLGRQAQILSVNHAVYELSGLSENEVIGADLHLLFDDKSSDEIKTFIKDASKCRSTRVINGELNQKAGTPRVVEISIHCTTDNNRHIYWLLVKNKSFRKEMEESLRKSEIMLKTTLESLPFDFWINDVNNRTYMQNSISKALWGDVHGRLPTEVTDHEGTVELWLETTTAALNGETYEGEINYYIRGKKRFFRNIVAPIKDGEHILGILGMNIDITDLKEALEARDMLLKETHHRVKNNLQMIIGILNLEALHCLDPEQKTVFTDLINRIVSISIIHEKLYKTESTNIIHSAEYIKDLTDHVMQTFKPEGNSFENLKADYNLADIELGVDLGINLGLIVNELITNSMKYAFSENRENRIRVSLYRKDENIVLEVGDNGPGIPDSFDFQKGDSLGLKLIHKLTGQINGTNEQLRDDGFFITRIVFPA